MNGRLCCWILHCRWPPHHSSHTPACRHLWARTPHPLCGNIYERHVWSLKVWCHLYRGCLYVLTGVPRIEQHIEISVGVPWSALFSQISHNCYKGAEAANDAAGVRCYAHGHIIALLANHTTLPAPVTFPSSDGHNDVGILVFIRWIACEDRCMLYN